VVCQLEANGGFTLLKLPWSNLDVEIVPLVRNLQNLGPGKSVDSKSETMKYTS
jgi:hypothetical protein